MRAPVASCRPAAQAASGGTSSNCAPSRGRAAEAPGVRTSPTIVSTVRVVRRIDAVAATPWYEEMLHSGALGYMIDGGFFMWPILFLGILAFGVIIERYRSLKMLNTDTEALRHDVLDLLRR